MSRETLRIKYVKDGKIVTVFSIDFRKWRKLHRDAGCTPFVIETGNKGHIEVTLRSESMDVEMEERKIEGVSE